MISRTVKNDGNGVDYMVRLLNGCLCKWVYQVKQYVYDINMW